LHDHGNGAGAVVVVNGALLETEFREDAGGESHTRVTVLPTAGAVVFGAGRVHDLINPGTDPVISVHVCAPRLTTMTYYELVEGRAIPNRTVCYRLGWDVPW
jgi:predicted metal-dependent enzyme (double-stranded beta helix superfamily)